MESVRTAKQGAESRLRMALDLQQAGFDMKRQALRRKFPEASADEIQRMFREWLWSHPFLGFDVGDHAEKRFFCG